MNNLNILTFNISWGSMMMNPNDATAKAIALKCINDGKIPDKSTCVDNVTKILSNGTTYGIPYDIIALQEASKNDLIYNSLNSHTNGIYKMINDTIGLAEIATIYNTKKLRAIESYCVNSINSTSDSRPVLIILFADNYGNQFIHINIHCSHYDNINFFNNILSDIISSNLTSIDINIFIGIIISGDFNDHGNRDYWKNKINISLGGQQYNIKTNVNPPFTCCIGRNTIRGQVGKQNEYDDKYGDYTIISQKFNFDVINTIPDYEKNAEKFPTSDHLACYCVITYNNQVSIPKPIHAHTPSYSLETIKGKKYKLKQGINSKTLRLQPFNNDPNIIKYEKLNGGFFKGDNVNNNTLLICPTKEKIEESNGIELVLVQSVDQPQKIGYLRKNYINETTTIIKNTNTPKTLRLQCDSSDPNKDETLNKKPFRGFTLNAHEKLIYPNEAYDISGDNDYILVVVADNPNIIGFINKAYIEEVKSTGGRIDYLTKYMKYKNKYLKLKNNM
jgi:hypothetical protein